MRDRACIHPAAGTVAILDFGRGVATGRGKWPAVNVKWQSTPFDMFFRRNVIGALGGLKLDMSSGGTHAQAENVPANLAKPLGFRDLD